MSFSGSIHYQAQDKINIFLSSWAKQETHFISPYKYMAHNEIQQLSTQIETLKDTLKLS